MAKKLNALYHKAFVLERNYNTWYDFSVFLGHLYDDVDGIEIVIENQKCTLLT